ncbi:Protein NDNF [Orchesella cincta]|uniref:Protein NDNF n=1 Tax=Orchesella cincta TaxID=48709 RepID=A0A1D2M7S7_ORCCI|nr:Protein NDNF [Orchesella cincta]
MPNNGNPLSITVTPCTSILLWNVKFWSVSENGTFGMPETLKTFRTQRTISFKEHHSRRGVFGVEIRAIYRDSYVHLYATSFSDEPLRLTPTMVNEPYDRSSYFPWSNVYDGLNPWSTNKDQKLSSFQSGVVSDFHSAYVTSSRPKISVKRLRGNRLHVKWDTSPVNPHLMNYCIVVNTRRDYTSLCAASGERYGVLPPDLMHVVYYGSETYFGEESSSNTWNEPNRYFMDQAVPFSNSTLGLRNNQQHLRHQHKLRHDRNKIKRATSYTHKDIIIGCVGKKTNYILNNLRDGMLYYVNVFVRDMSTNISYPFVRTTMKYRIPRDSPNGLKDAKPTKIKLPITNNTGVRLVRKPTTLRFNLNKPCNKLTMYVMPCGGGSINTEVLHGNSTLSETKNVDSLDIITIDSPKRGRYFIKIYQNLEESQARMVEVYVAKKNKRFPLPKLPVITKISEDESRRTCDSVTIQWWPSPDPRDNEYCIFLKEETRKKRIFQFKKPNQCDVERSLKSDPYVSLSLCLQRDPTTDDNMLAQRIVGLLPGKTYVVQLIIRRHNGKSLSYDLHHVKTNDFCLET